jgi:hypothetical protein
MPSLRKSRFARVSPCALKVVNFCGRKNRDVAEVFAKGFEWKKAIDATADVYNGVRNVDRRVRVVADSVLVRFLVHSHIPRCLCLV